MAESIRVGEVLASKYRLEELLGSGGMGDVYRAVNQDIGRTVAIKVLRAEHATNADLVDRFLREARAANMVRHPNVVDVLDVGRDADGAPFMVQELLKGQDLARYLGQRGGRLSLEEVELYLLPVIDAVALAHARGVVHRDIKPENVFLDDQGKRRVPKLLDFGISKIRRANTRLTDAGVMLGTPAYMAPEQVQGSREANPQTDVWALGTMLFEVLAGRLPFGEMDAPQLFVAIATTDAPRLSDVMAGIHPDISRIVQRCLRRVETERYPTALELARDMRHVLSGTELEPTQLRSLPPAALAAIALAVPDLVIPPDRMPPALKALAQAARSSPNPMASNDVGPPSSRNALAARSADVPPSKASSSSKIAAAPSSSRGLPASPALAVRSLPERELPPADTTSLVGGAVVAATTIGAIGALMSVAHRPGGFGLVNLIAKPSPTLNMVVQGGLGLVGVIIAGQFFVQAFKKWRGEIIGGRLGALAFALISGALFFAALELIRAAF